jgi:cytochrome c oxidase subunit II
MNKFDRVVARIALPLVIMLLAAVPLGIWYYEKVEIPKQYPPGAKIIEMWAYGRDGQWTLGKINGINYWQGAGGRMDQVVVHKGDTVVFRVNSADVTHSFSIPDLGILARYILPGYPLSVQFVADKPGSYEIRCREFCSPGHPAMFARLVVED